LVQVLAPAVVDAVVVGPKEVGDHRAHGPWGVAERLAGEDRGELHHARALLGGGVASGAELDGLVADRSHDGAVSFLAGCRLRIDRSLPTGTRVARPPASRHPTTRRSACGTNPRQLT